MTEDHQAAELLPGRGVSEVLASIVEVQDTGQQIVLTREGFKVNGSVVETERGRSLSFFGVLNVYPFVLASTVCFKTVETAVMEDVILQTRV